MQADGKKIVDPCKQDGLKSRLEMELSRPLRVSLISRGPDTELLVANPVELSGKGRPLVFYDITLALKMLDTPIFSVISTAHIPHYLLLLCASIFFQIILFFRFRCYFVSQMKLLCLNLIQHVSL